MALQHLRSSTASKRPTPAAMSDGQLALNTNDGSPGLFFKDSNGGLVKVGPVHVGTTAPNATPGAGGSSGNSVGEQWLDTAGGTYVFKVWDGSAWRSETGTFVDVNGDVMTGALGIIAGSAGSPGLYFSGDTNTGIYSPGADQVAISTNGTGRLFVDASGNVIAGTASPVNVRRLHIVDSNQVVASIESTGTTAARISFKDANTTDNAQNSIGAIGQNLVFWSGNTERMRLDSSGRLGIGTSTVSANVQIQGTDGAPAASGNMNTGIVYQTGAGTRALNIGVDSTNQYAWINSAYSNNSGIASDTGLRLMVGAQPAITIDSSRRVGIGTSPSNTLHVYNTAATDAAQIQSTQNFSTLKFTSATNSSGVVYGINGAGGAEIENKDATKSFSIVVGGSEKARLTPSGQWLVGTSSGSLSYSSVVVRGNPAASGVQGTLELSRASLPSTNGSGIGTIAFTDSSSNLGATIAAIAEGSWTSGSNHRSRLEFSTCPDGSASPVERLRITNNGNVFINSTSNPAVGTEMFGVAAQASGQTIAAGFANTVNTSPTVFIINNSNTTNTFLMRFTSGSGGNTRGEIYYNGSQLVYATSSDYRLKENVQPFSGGIDIVKQLRPVKYNWIENSNEDIGFIAHEVQEVFPNAVGGQKDAVDEDGKILPQTYDPSKLVPLLTAALQEAIGEIESLKARVAALESA